MLRIHLLQNWSKVEHPFRVIKRQFGYAKVRFRGLAKNTAQLVTLFVLSNVWMARRELLAKRERCAGKTQKTGQKPNAVHLSARDSLPSPIYGRGPGERGEIPAKQSFPPLPLPNPLPKE